MKAIVFDQIGDPLEVLRIEDVPVPELKENHVLVKMNSSAINPGDFLFIQNLYPPPKKPKFPRQVAGNHGAGIVVKAGKNVAVKEGTLVAFSYYNSWAEYALIPEEWLIELPPDFPIEKAGQFFNLITGYELLAASGALNNQWLALTAGHSTVSVITAQFAKARGVKVISVIRKKQPTIELKTMGTDVVIDLSETNDIKTAVHQITGSKGINGLIDNVGGPITADLIRSMALGGQVVINGGMSNEQYSLHNFDILLNLVDIRPYVYRYFFNPPVQSDRQILNEIIHLSKGPEFIIPVAQSHPLTDFKDAIYQTISEPAKGKHLFDFKESG